MFALLPPRFFQKLPHTMKMALLFRETLEPLLDVFHGSWAYGDRVLLWLAPCFEADLERFYQEDGTDMEGMFDVKGLEHLDRDFSMLLYRKIKELKRTYPVQANVIAFLQPEACFFLD